MLAGATRPPVSVDITVYEIRTEDYALPVSYRMRCVNSVPGGAPYKRWTEQVTCGITVTGKLTGGGPEYTRYLA